LDLEVITWDTGHVLMNTWMRREQDEMQDTIAQLV